jgi:hypothetical protein
MKTEQDQSGHNFDRARQWIEACGNTVRRTTAALTQNDLATLEDCIEEQGNLIYRYTELVAGTVFDMDRKSDASLTAARDSLRSLAFEVRTLNRRNAILAANGLDYSGILLEVLRPSLTYGPLSQGVIAISHGSSEPTFSTEC